MSSGPLEFSHRADLGPSALGKLRLVFRRFEVSRHDELGMGLCALCGHRCVKWSEVILHSMLESMEIIKFILKVAERAESMTKISWLPLNIFNSFVFFQKSLCNAESIWKLKNTLVAIYLWSIQYRSPFRQHTKTIWLCPYLQLLCDFDYH